MLGAVAAGLWSASAAASTPMHLKRMSSQSCAMPLREKRSTCANHEKETSVLNITHFFDDARNLVRAEAQVDLTLLHRNAATDECRARPRTHAPRMSPAARPASSPWCCVVVTGQPRVARSHESRARGAGLRPPAARKTRKFESRSARVAKPDALCAASGNCNWLRVMTPDLPVGASSAVRSVWITSVPIADRAHDLVRGVFLDVVAGALKDHRPVVGEELLPPLTFRVPERDVFRWPDE
jgi:hypothetical protein